MQILVRKAESEVERRKKETASAILRHYYNREIRDGSRMKLVASKERIKRLYALR
jgi:hypothetical protein